MSKMMHVFDLASILLTVCKMSPQIPIIHGEEKTLCFQSVLFSCQVSFQLIVDGRHVRRWLKLYKSGRFIGPPVFEPVVLLPVYLERHQPLKLKRGILRKVFKYAGHGIFLSVLYLQALSARICIPEESLRHRLTDQYRMQILEGIGCAAIYKGQIQQRQQGRVGVFALFIDALVPQGEQLPEIITQRCPGRILYARNLRFDRLRQWSRCTNKCSRLPFIGLNLHDPVEVIPFRKIMVVCVLVFDPEKDQGSAGNAYRQAGDIHDAETFVLTEITDRCDKIIADHSSRYFFEEMMPV